MQWLILSKALLASKNAAYRPTEIKHLLKYSMNSVSAHTHTLVEWPALCTKWLFAI